MTDQIGEFFLADGEKKPAGVFPDFGDRVERSPAIYEVIRVEESVPLFIEDYLERMQMSFSQLGRDVPFVERQLVEDIHRLIRMNNHRSGPVKLVFGFGDPPFTILYLMRPHLPAPEAYRTGVKAILMNETRENPNVKSWNQGLRDRSVRKLRETDAYEAILVDGDGYITEASRSNVFFILNERVYTSPVKHVLPGITRKKVLEVCEKKRIPVVFDLIAARQIGNYQGCFLTGTARRVVPVRSVGDIGFTPDTAVFTNIAEAFESVVQDYIRTHR